MNRSEFRKRFNSRKIVDEIRNLDIHRMWGYIDSCKQVGRPPIELVHVISHLLETSKELQVFLDENPDCITFSDFAKRDSKKYNDIRDKILGYCDNYCYRV